MPSINHDVEPAFLSLIHPEFEHLGVLSEVPRVVSESTTYEYLLFGGLPVGIVIPNSELPRIVTTLHSKVQPDDLFWIRHTEDGEVRIILFPRSIDPAIIAAAIEKTRLR